MSSENIDEEGTISIFDNIDRYRHFFDISIFRRRTLPGGYRLGERMIRKDRGIAGKDPKGGIRE